MSSTCTICRKSNNSQHFVRLYEDSYEEVYQNNLLREKTEFTFVHPICASFFWQTELIVLNSLTNPCLLDASENKIMTEAIICNSKEISRQNSQNCEVCSIKLDEEMLIACIVEYSLMIFFFHCL